MVWRVSKWKFVTFRPVWNIYWAMNARLYQTAVFKCGQIEEKEWEKKRKNRWSLIFSRSISTFVLTKTQAFYALFSSRLIKERSSIEFACVGTTTAATTRMEYDWESSQLRCGSRHRRFVFKLPPSNILRIIVQRIFLSLDKLAHGFTLSSTWNNSLLISDLVFFFTAWLEQHFFEFLLGVGFEWI